MSPQASCPVFRCPKTSVSQCTGYRRACQRYYCQTHTKGTLCDRCLSLKQEDMKAEYRQMLKSLVRKSYSASMTKGVVALFLISLLLLVVAAVGAFSQKGNVSAFTIISLLGGGFGFLGSLFWSYVNAREYIRAESVELDLTHPGFYDFCQRWQKTIDDISTPIV